MSGWVGRDSGNITEDGKDTIELMQERKGKKYKIFPGREEAVNFMRFTEHFTVDDIVHMYWIDESDEEIRNLYTGEYTEGFRTIEGKLMAYNFWECENCHLIFKISVIPTCIVCGSDFRFNVSVADLIDYIRVTGNMKLLTNRERISLQDLHIQI